MEIKIECSHGKVFKWQKDVTLTAIDELSLALPREILGNGEKFESVIHIANGDMNVGLYPESNLIYLFLKPGMSVKLLKNSQAIMYSNDKKPRKLKSTAALEGCTSIDN